MNGNQYFANRYQEVDANTATPVHLVVMLYDAAACSLEEARGHMQSNNIAGRSKAINKCNAIISELQSSLNLKGGGEIASSLNRLYDYMKMTLFRAGAEQNLGLLAEVSGLLETLRSAWREIDSGAASSPVESSIEVKSLQDAGFNENYPTAADDGYVKSFSISA